MKISLRTSATRKLKRIAGPQRDILHANIRELADFPHTPNIKKLANYQPASDFVPGNFGFFSML